MENKAYSALYHALAALYFIDVFIGLFLLESKLRNDNLKDYREYIKGYSFTSNICDVIEVGLLGIILIDLVIKICNLIK